MPKLSDEKYKMIVDDYVSGMKQTDVGVKHGIGRCAVSEIVRRLGVETREYTGSRQMSTRKFFWDFEFFNKQNPVVAYWAGFMLADGHIHIGDTGGASLISYVHPHDKEHMQRFLVDIGATSYPVRTTKNGYVGFNLNYAGLPKQLSKWGVTPHKTETFGNPEVPGELLSHFLRGWIDGDGSVYRYGQSSRVSVSSGNIESLDWFAQALRVLGYDGGVGIHEVKAWPGNYTLYIGGRRQVEKICALLLVDTEYCMDRKWKTSFYENKGQMFEHTCEICGKPFLVPKHRHESEPQNGRFCSRVCFHQSLRNSS